MFFDMYNALPSNFVSRSSTRRLSAQIQVVAAFVLRVSCTSLASIFLFFALYYLAASPPMHWFYEVSPPAGPSSVYIPGGGFSGFWFHLGYLQSLPNIKDYDYYCFSSGCLGILVALMNRTVDDVASIGFASQNAWMSGNITRFELVEYFIDNLLADETDERINRVLPNIKVLVTTTKDGFEVREATSRDELKDLIAKTTWVPYLTGWGFLSDEKDVYLDGGFSRMLHPTCEYSLHLPLIWDTIIHTFSPGLSIDQVMHLSQSGAQYDFGLPKDPLAEQPIVSSHVAAPSQPLRPEIDPFQTPVSRTF